MKYLGFHSEEIRNHHLIEGFVKGFFVGVGRSVLKMLEMIKVMLQLYLDRLQEFGVTFVKAKNAKS